MKKTISLLLSLVTVFGTAVFASAEENEKYPSAVYINLNGDSAEMNSEEVSEYSYTWHCDPSVSHDEVKDAPAEYYTGEKPEETPAIYIDHELYYYPSLDESGFSLVNYDGEQEWAYYYTDGVNNDYIFATLPRLGDSIPTYMMHTEEEAAENKVLHITEAGTYILSGEWKGQISIDLGDTDEVFTDENQKVNIVLNGANITCTVAPGIVFKNVYECDNTWEESEEHSVQVDTINAGATVTVADGTDNTVSGENIFRMLKTKYKDENSTDEIKTQKKMRKIDAALYSYMTMNITAEEEGTGTLTVNSGFEGIDSELHMNIMGGNITVNSQDDGMNVNEDDVSVMIFSGGNVTVNAALGAEGDGVDSNGFIRIDGGTININGIRVPDSALDSEDGISYNGGTVIIDGEEQSYETGSVFRETGNMFGGFGGGKFGDMNGQPPQMPEGDMPGGNFGGREFSAPENFDIKTFKEEVAQLPDDASFEDVMSLLRGQR